VKVEQKWLNKSDRLFQRLPPMVRIIFVVSALLGLLISWMPELRVGLPLWLRISLFVPAVVLFLEAIVFVIIRWTGVASSPFRKAAAHLRKAR
jgi:hypothetical protein